MLSKAKDHRFSPNPVEPFYKFFPTTMRNFPPYFIKQFSEYSFVAPYLLSIAPFPV